MSDEGSPPVDQPKPAPRPAEPERPPAEKPGGDARPPKDGADQDPAAGGADQEEREREAKERERAEGLFRAASQDPRDEGEEGAGDAAASAQAHRSARASYNVHRAGRDQNNFDRAQFQSAHFGDITNTFRLAAMRSAVFSGPVPEEELSRLRRSYRKPQGFGELEQALLARRLLVLGAAPGSGRTCTALVLLDRTTGALRGPGPSADPRVSRLDPRTVLAELERTSLNEHGRGHGFVLELPEGNDADLIPAEVHLDALAALLRAQESYAVLVVASGTATTALLSGRYGMLCPPAPTDELLAARLEERLGDSAAPDDDVLRRAVALALDPEVEAAVGLEALRPVEAEALADLLAGHTLGELSRDELLSGCGDLVSRQTYDWFAGLDREIGGEQSPGVPSAATLLYPAAFRIALSVFNGSTHSIVAETAHDLAWELAVAREPERAPARALFCDDQPVALSLSRAVLDQGRLMVADVALPVRTVRFQGAALAGAVLEEVWMRHDAARPPVVRWLRALADDPRPQVRIRAAVAAGELCVLDFEYGYEQLVRPMATASGARRRMFAATALDQASRHDSHRTAVRALVSAWARSDSTALRWTAAVALGYGNATASVGTALDLLLRIAMRNDGEHLAVVSHSTVLLAAGADDMTVLRRIAEWIRGRRRDRMDQDLGLLSVARLAATRVGDIWDDDASPDLIEYQTWPLALALVMAREGRAVPVADLLGHALQVLRSRAAITASLGDWLRRASAEDGGQLLDGLARLLPLLLEDEEDRERLRWLVHRMVEDEDDPISVEQARRIWRTVEPAPPRGHQRGERT